MPYRGGQIPLLTQEEIDRHGDVHHDFHSKEFDLTNAEHKAEYDSIMDHIVNGWYSLVFIDRYREPESKKRYAYVEWTQRYGALSSSAALRSVSSISHVG